MERESNKSQEPQASTAQDFYNNLTTTGPVVGGQERAQPKNVQEMSIFSQQQIIAITSQIITQLMPVILKQVTTVISEMNQGHL